MEDEQRQRDELRLIIRNYNLYNVSKFFREQFFNSEKRNQILQSQNFSKIKKALYINIDIDYIYVFRREGGIITPGISLILSNENCLIK